MDSKKRPPPGATLISRLREGRLRREQQLAEKKGKEEGSGSSAGEAEDTGAAASVKAVGQAPRMPLASRPRPKLTPPAPEQSRDAAIAAEAVAPLEVTLAPESIKVAPPVEAPSTLAPAQDFSPPPPGIFGKQRPADLIRRTLSIEDLRPTSDDYDQLTEEIRQAGRFAAAGLIAQGLRLARIKDDHIYRTHYATFEEYCRKEHTMSATYAYRLIRMAEMAERLTEEGSRGIGREYAASMPDPFEVMLSLGHRHLLAILPLEVEAAEDLLVHGVPLLGEPGQAVERIPITQATEQQIRQALKLMLPRADKRKPQKPRKSGPASRSVKTMKDLCELLQEWADWLEAEPDSGVLAQRVGEGRERARLAQRFRSAAERIFNSL